VSASITQNLRTNSTFEVEYRLRLVGDQTRHVRVRGRSEYGADKKILRIAGTVVDITERRRMEAEVEQQGRSLAHLARVGVIGELSGALAHELNQPLTAILSNAQAVQRMLEQQPIDIDELRSAIADIIQDDSRAGDVIRHLRALLKNDNATVELLDLNTIVVRAIDLTRSDLTARNIALVMRLAPQNLPISGDTVQLQQLLLNLIINAADAMATGPDPKGTIIVASDVVAGNILHVCVADTGPGIGPDLADKLFEPFFSTKPHGLGLGLSISRAIVVGHGGKIWAENNPGQGATFHVSFPSLKEATS
jgi:two-component system sensor kinase FixL